jgi:pyruvate dehydrogenase E1 component beta subunit
MTLMRYAEAIADAHRVAMRDDPRVFAIGEDIGQYGGFYRATAGLQEEFGKGRVLDTPISEAAIAGASVGAALVGARPILEIGFVDFVGACWDQVFNQAAKFRYISGGRASVPLVIRMACGAGLGYGVHHSQSLEAWFTHIPGLKVAMPATPADAKGLLLTAIDDDDPVVFFEHKFLYAQKGEVPDGRYTVPLGRANVAREGTDITIVTWSGAVPWALAAADTAARDGIECQVIDLRTLVPLDEATVLAAVHRTGRLIVCHEACVTGGFGAEVVARVVEHAFDSLDAPPVRVAAPDIPVPNSLPLEAEYLRPRTVLIDAIRKLAATRHHRV